MLPLNMRRNPVQIHNTAVHPSPSVARTDELIHFPCGPSRVIEQPYRAHGVAPDSINDLVNWVFSFDWPGLVTGIPL